jgi:hypothetical protein
VFDRPAEAFDPSEGGLLNDRFCHPATAHASTSGELSLCDFSRILMPPFMACQPVLIRCRCGYTPQEGTHGFSRLRP